eukprot:MONOS_13013.1-p1 / transcript=MONOS_13013.1 / gene=MONOS_13013 / organism=Monocercomonoides_exilis_PA203 / gene_product=Glutaredoxin 8 / transcript_product=Glutaredoxin 8 / location=Mono_scaffold00766:17470-18036(-) / protein_length=156 / sequence_SO=supercontig / SO=protein_coding / is_pseudo=false
MMFLAVISLLNFVSPREVFTGDKFMDGVILDSKLTVLIKPKCPDCYKITNALETAGVPYNVLQTMTLGAAVEDAKKILSKIPPQKPASQVIPAVICNKRYIGGLNEIMNYVNNGEIKDIIEGTKEVGTLVFHEQPDENEAKNEKEEKKEEKPSEL